MRLKLLREPSGADSTFGILLIDGFLQCYTLENSRKLIPLGTFTLTKYMSPHNKMEVLLLNDVPGRSYIEIHPANYYHELEGCIAPGMEIIRPSISSSRDAFNAVMKKVEFPATIEISIL